MLMTPVGRTIAELDTPSLLLDLDAFERNARKMMEHLRSRGKAWRPHAKAFKCPAIAHVLRRLGAIGVTVAKVSEAEVMAAAGIEDILIAHLVVGGSKPTRLAALQRHANVMATVDHPDQIGPLATAANRLGTRIGLLVDVNLGMNRTGVETPEAAASLAAKIAQHPSLCFRGVMGYEGHTLMIEDPATKKQAIFTAHDRLAAAVRATNQQGLECSIVSAGGSGSYQIAADHPVLTELQAGGGVFFCNYYAQACHVHGHEPALFVLASVVSRPAADRIILDIGQKSVSPYRVMPTLPSFPTAEVQILSAEHATLKVPADCPLRLGDTVRVIPGYSDFTFVLHDEVLGIRGEIVETCWRLLGRGMLQ